MTELDVMKMTACPKCGLEFNTLLHSLCLHENCPVRGSRTMRELADEGMRQGRAISASPRIWEYEGFDGKWRECRNADDACMWAEDGRRIREKLQPPAGETIRSTQDGSMEAAPETGQSPVGAVSTNAAASYGAICTLCGQTFLLSGPAHICQYNAVQS